MLLLLLFVYFAPTLSQFYPGNSIQSGQGFGRGFGGGFHGWQRPCGLPHYVNQLPADLQMQVRTIWATYREGESCDMQRAQSRQIFWSLPESQRSQIWQTMRQNWGGRGGHWANRPCGPPRMIGSFPPQIQQQVRAIWATYQPGAPCDQQRQQTHQLFWSLPQETRMQMWQQMRQSWASRFGGGQSQFGGEQFQKRW